MTKPLLHVLFGPSAAGTLRQALAGSGRDDQVVCFHDDFSFGPIDRGDAARAAWVEAELGVTDWDEVVAGDESVLRASKAGDVDPMAWFSRRDARSYAGLLQWLAALGDTPCRLVDVTDATVSDGRVDWLAISPSVLPPDQMLRLIDTGVALTADSRRDFQACWRRLMAEKAPLRVIDDELALVSAPLDVFDARLLALAEPNWRKMAFIVGSAMADIGDTGRHQAGDLVLAGRVAALAEAGALEWRGDLSSMRDCEVRLPGGGR